MESLTIIPAVDIKGGRAVRLHQGDRDRITDYGDPLERAKEFQSAGASWLHLVDLDAAFGDGSNWKIIERIVSEAGLSVEVSGGIRDDATLDRALSSGCQRVTIGTAAIEKPEWIAEKLNQHGEKIIVALDLRDGLVATRGWTDASSRYQEVISRLDRQGCSRYMVTDIAKDGTLSGPNLELLQSVAQVTSAKLIASGGIANLRDISDLRALVGVGLESAIIGKALYEGSFSLKEAIEMARGE